MKRQQLWTANNYRSSRVSLSDDEEDRADETITNDEDTNELLDENHGTTAIHYVFGDVMKPQVNKEKNAISVHCVGKSLA